MSSTDTIVPTSAPKDIEYADSVYTLNEKPGLKSKLRQFGKLLRSKGPLFWCLFCFIFLIVILGLIAIIIYFGFWRGVPTVKVLSVEPPVKSNGNSAGANAKIDLGVPGIRPPSFSLTVTVNIEINNENLFDLNFENMNITVADTVAPNFPIGGAFIDALTLPKSQKSYLSLPLRISYSFGSNDPDQLIPKDLMASCSVGKGQSKPYKQLEINVQLTGQLVLTPQIKFSVGPLNQGASFDCPQTFPSTFSIGGTTYQLSNLDWSSIAKGQIGTSISAIST